MCFVPHANQGPTDPYSRERDTIRACHLLTSREWSETEIPPSPLSSYPPPRISSFSSFLGPSMPSSPSPSKVMLGNPGLARRGRSSALGLLMSNDCTGLLYGTRRKEEGFFLLSCAMDFCLGPLLLYAT